jgi:hypothetical protein
MTRPRPGPMMFDTSMIAILIVLAIFTLGITAWAAWENWPISWRVGLQGDVAARAATDETTCPMQ